MNHTAESAFVCLQMFVHENVLFTLSSCHDFYNLWISEQK